LFKLARLQYLQIPLAAVTGIEYGTRLIVNLVRLATVFVR